MPTTKEDLSHWFDEGVGQKATHMIVVCDTFDYEDYPVYVSPSEKVEDKVEKYKKESMQKIMEVYNLSLPKSPQVMGNERVWNL